MSERAVSFVGSLETVERDCPCVCCGYNLRTIRVGAGCPECGTAAGESMRAHARKLAGADRRWLRAVTNGVLWLVLAMLVPAAFVFLAWPEEDRGPWWTADRMRLLIVLTPAIFAIVGCWRLGAPEPRPRVIGEDQPVTRWALRVMAACWVGPLFLIAGPIYRTIPPAWYDPGLLEMILMWSGLPATVLVYRRLKYFARRMPSGLLLHQCNVIGSQMPVAIIVLELVFERSARFEPDAFRYAVMAPIPGVGLPWPMAFNAEYLERVNWDYLFHPEILIVAWPVLFSVGGLLLMVQFLVALILVRRGDRELPAYCRGVLERHGAG